MWTIGKSSSGEDFKRWAMVEGAEGEFGKRESIGNISKNIKKHHACILKPLHFSRYTEKEKREGRREDELLNVKSGNNGGNGGNGGSSSSNNKPDRNNLAASAANNSAGASDVEKEAGKLASLPPAKISLPKDVKVVHISTGLHLSLIHI